MQGLPKGDGQTGPSVGIDARPQRFARTAAAVKMHHPCLAGGREKTFFDLDRHHCMDRRDDFLLITLAKNLPVITYDLLIIFPRAQILLIITESMPRIRAIRCLFRFGQMKLCRK